MSARVLLEAFALPASTRVERRIPKSLLLERGAPTAADRRQVRDGLERLTWSASLKPTTVAVPAFSDDVHEYLEIHVVLAALRAEAKPPRLVELLHRAIPYPVVLCVEHRATLSLSLAHKRKSQGEIGAVVLEESVETPDLATGSIGDATQRFLATLAVATVKPPNLFALYQAWFERVVALKAATITGTFALPASPERAVARAAALTDYSRIDRELAALRAQAGRERQLNRRVELNLAVRRLESELTQAVSAL